MHVHSNISKQIRSAQDIKIFSILFLFSFLAIMILSFFLQQIYTAERNAGRNIRTEADAMSVSLFQTRTRIVLLYLDCGAKGKAASSDELQTLNVGQRILQQDHAYLFHTSVLKSAYTLLLQQEQTYSILNVLINVLKEPKSIVSESLTRLFISYSNTYEAMLVQFQSEYTQFFVSNNNSASLFSLFELGIEIAILAVFFYSVLNPAIKKFTRASRESSVSQQELIETKSLINSTIRTQGTSALNLALDVVCADHYIYKVAGKGNTMTVFYNEAARIFICECSVYIQTKTCFHVNRAAWLHNRIFRKNTINKGV